MGLSQYTDTSSAFSIRPDPRVAHEVRQRVERSLNLAVRPERIRLPRQARDLGQRQVLLVAQPEQQTLLGRQPSQGILATVVAPAAPRSGRRARARVAQLPRGLVVLRRRPREVAGSASARAPLSCQRCCGVSNSNSRALISDTVASVSSGNRGSSACRHCARDMLPHVDAADTPAGRARAGAIRTAWRTDAPLLPCGASPRRGSQRRP